MARASSYWVETEGLTQCCCLNLYSHPRPTGWGLTHTVMRWGGGESGRQLVPKDDAFHIISALLEGPRKVLLNLKGLQWALEVLMDPRYWISDLPVSPEQLTHSVFIPSSTSLFNRPQSLIIFRHRVSIVFAPKLNSFLTFAYLAWVWHVWRVVARHFAGCPSVPGHLVSRMSQSLSHCALDVVCQDWFRLRR